VRVLLRHGAPEGSSVNPEGVARAHEFASKVDEPAVWSELAAAHLERGETADAIAAYLRAGDASAYAAVIDAVQRSAGPAAAAASAGAPISASSAPLASDPAAAASAYADLVRFLQMARKKNRDPLRIDTELLYALARTNALGELDAFVHGGAHGANVSQAADRCFDEGLYEAARALYASVPNWGRLASALVRLRRFQEATDAARKANAPRTWKEVGFACVEEGEDKLAQLCGLHIVVDADELDEASSFFFCFLGVVRGSVVFFLFAGGRVRDGGTEAGTEGGSSRGRRPAGTKQASPLLLPSPTATRLSQSHTTHSHSRSHSNLVSAHITKTKKNEKNEKNGKKRKKTKKNEKKHAKRRSLSFTSAAASSTSSSPCSRPASASSAPTWASSPSSACCTPRTGPRSCPSTSSSSQKS